MGLGDDRRLRALTHEGPDLEPQVEGMDAMRTVKVNQAEFIETLRANRSQHRAVFETALEGYGSRLLRELEHRVHDLRRGRAVDVHIALPEPEDHTEDYDRILAMASMSVEKVIELTQEDFAMYVMDQWHWKRAFTVSTERYL